MRISFRTLGSSPFSFSGGVVRVRPKIGVSHPFLRHITTTTGTSLDPESPSPAKSKSRTERFHWHQPGKNRKVGGRIRSLRQGGLESENTKLTEVITIYEKLTKSRGMESEGESADEQYVFKSSSDYFEYFPDDEGNADYYKSQSHVYPKISQIPAKEDEVKPKPGTTEDSDDTIKVLDFSKFRNIISKNYAYFSAKTGLIQADTLESLEWKDTTAEPTSPFLTCGDLLNSKKYCLNIANPKEKDLLFLGSQFHVHDLTLRDIRKAGTEEKVEVFKYYTFLSLKPYMDSCNSAGATNDSQNQSCLGKQTNSATSSDTDLNILLFPDFAIILHYGEHWSGYKDMLGFLNLLCSYGNSPLTPDWVLFSIFIELAQDAKYSVKQLEPKILNMNVAAGVIPNESDQSTKDEASTELSQVLTKNFDNEFEIYRINRFIKPKIKVLKVLKAKCENRVGSGVLNLLSGTRKDFEEVGETLGHYSHILERSQDTCLTLANVRQSQEANKMGKVMKRISEVALLFLPLQAMAGFLGMNLRVPYQEWDSTLPFWSIIGSSSVLVIVLYTISKRRAAVMSLPLVGQQMHKFGEKLGTQKAKQ